MGYLLCCTVMDLSLCIAFCIVLCCTIALLPGTRSHLSLTRPSLNLSFLDSVTQQCIVLYCTVLYCTVQCCIVLYLIVLYCIVLYSTALYSALLYRGPDPALICHSLTLWTLMPSRS